MNGLDKAQSNYDRQNGEVECKRDTSEFSLDDMSADQYAARLAKMNAIKAAVAAKFATK